MGPGCVWQSTERTAEGQLGDRGTQTKPEEDDTDKRKQITESNLVKEGNRVHVLTLNPRVHVL